MRNATITLVWAAMLNVIPVLCDPCQAALNDWVEGTQAEDNGATRDYYNAAGHLSWQNFMGDWRDASDVSQGDHPFAVTTLLDDDTQEYVSWNVTTLVQDWLNGIVANQGFFLRKVGGGGTYLFRSRESLNSNEHPELVLHTLTGTSTLAPEADTYLAQSTYQCMGDAEELRIDSTNPILLRFDFSTLSPGITVTQATLRLFTVQEFGGSTFDAGVFRCTQGHHEPSTPPRFGLAFDYLDDQDIATHPSVVFFDGFESVDWEDGWTFNSSPSTTDVVSNDLIRSFTPLRGRALRSRVPEGSQTGLNMGYKFQDETGSEPEEIYFRYYLRFADDWDPTVWGGKLPGISGTYGVAGWGGRKSNGSNGWSARGDFAVKIQPENVLEGHTPIGFYVYHADMPGTFGDVWLWQNDYRGFLPNNMWFCIEQYCKMNTPGQQDGELRAWVNGRLAFEKMDLRFRDVDSLKIEQIWMNIFHGGTAEAPANYHAYIDHVVIASEYIGPMRTLDDRDGDGARDWEEEVAGTDPADDTSLFQVHHIDHDNLDVTVSWSSSTNRHYDLYRSTNLSSGYVPVVTGLTSTPPVNVYIDTTTNAHPAFYQLHVLP